MESSTPASDTRTERLHRALEETRQLLVDHVDRVIRELRGALVHVAASRVPLDSRLAEVALNELVGNDPEVRFGARTVMTVTAEFYGFTLEEFRGGRGPNSLCRARQIAMYLCRELTDLSLPRIGQEFDRDHTTAMHAVRKIGHEVVEAQRTRDQVRDLTVLIKRRAAMDALRDARRRAA